MSLSPEAPILHPVPVGGGLSIVVLLLLVAGYGYSAGIIPGELSSLP